MRGTSCDPTRLKEWTSDCQAMREVKSRIVSTTAPASSSGSGTGAPRKRGSLGSWRSQVHAGLQKPA